MNNTYKYRLYELKNANSMSVMDLATKCQVHIRTVYNWMYIRLGSKESIPADNLRKLAEIFGTTMEDMYTPVPQLENSEA